jgi:hypothetical protein
MEQPLIALSAVYPSAAVRSAIGPFIEAAAQVMVHPAALLSDPEAEPGTAALAQWLEQGNELYAVLARGWEALSRALNPEDASPHAAGPRARRPAARRSTAGPKWLSNGHPRLSGVPAADSAAPEDNTGA